MTLLIHEASVTRIIKPQLDLPTSPKEYRTLYEKSIGLYGNVLVRTKIEGKRAIWNGKFFTDRHMIPLYVDPKFCLTLPNDMCLDGILQGFSMDHSKPTNWDNLKYHVIDTFNKHLTFKSRVGLLQKIKCHNVIIPEWTFIQAVESNWKRINKLFEEKGDLIINRDILPYKIIYEYSYGKSDYAIIIDFIEGEGILSKFKCLSRKGNIFYLSKNIPKSIQNGYKFNRKICTYKDSSMPSIGDTIHYDTPSFVNGDVPTSPSYLLSTNNTN